MLGSIIDHNGEERRLGNIIPEVGDIKLGASWKVYGDNTIVTPMFSRDKWADQPVSPHIPKWVKDQRQTSACNAFAITYAMEGFRANRTFGASQIRLSPAPIYKAINGGVDEGSTLEDGMAQAMNGGTCPTSFAPETDWQGNNWQPGYKEAMKEYRVLEAYLCPTFAHIASALLSGFEVVFGVFWGRNDNIDDQGWISDDPAGGVAGGHALNAKAIAKRGSAWGVKGPNSWGKPWGANGWLITPESRFTGQFKGAWAIRSMTLADGDLEGVPAIN